MYCVPVRTALATHDSDKMARAACLVVVALFVQLTGGKDLYWARNTNWDEPSNWALGRVPCGGDTVTVSLNRFLRFSLFS